MSRYRLWRGGCVRRDDGTRHGQQVMGEPGYCAFYYPNANCQNKGPGNPYTGDAWLRLNQAAHAAPQPTAS